MCTKSVFTALTWRAPLTDSTLNSWFANLNPLDLVKSWWMSFGNCSGNGKALSLSLKKIITDASVEYGLSGDGLGPPLWNAFFWDCICAIFCCGFEVVTYADNWNAFRCFPRNLANAVVQEHLSERQASVRAWGRANRATFDVGKQLNVIISIMNPHGRPAKLLDIERKSISVSCCINNQV